MSRARLDRVPCQDERVQPTTSLAQASHFPLLPDMTGKGPSLLCQVCRRIDQDGEQTLEVVGLAMQKEKASLRGNSDTDFIRDFETVAAFKTLFGKKNLDVAEKLGRAPGENRLKNATLRLIVASQSSGKHTARRRCRRLRFKNPKITAESRRSPSRLPAGNICSKPAQFGLASCSRSFYYHIHEHDLNFPA